MRKIFTSGFVAALMIGFTALAGCSSGGGSESGLGLDVSGQWRGQLVERRSGRSAGSVSFLFQSDNNPLNPLFSTNHAVSGSYTFENNLVDDCPIFTQVGQISGTVVGNDLVMSAESDSSGDTKFTITFGGIVTNNSIQGDWNMNFDFKIIVETGKLDTDGFPETEEIDARCQNFGTWTATKISS